MTQHRMTQQANSNKRQPMMMSPARRKKMAKEAERHAVLMTKAMSKG